MHSSNKQNEVKNESNKSNQNIQNAEIIKLKEENNKLRNDLQKANKIIATLKLQKQNEIKITDNNEIKKLKEEIKLKEKQLNDLKLELENERNKNNNKLVNFDNIIVVYFTSTDQIINKHGVKCLKTDTFAEVEEKLYREYPEFRETNNFFISNGFPILRFKKIIENNLRDGSSIQLIKDE